MNISNPDCNEDEVTTAPRLIHSSQMLGWKGIEVQRWQEPIQSYHWQEPTSPDITLILIDKGITQLGESDRASCKGRVLRRGDLLLKPPSEELPGLWWQPRSEHPVETLRIRINHTLFASVAKELAERDPAGIALLPCAGIQDPLLFQIGLTLLRDLEAPSGISTLYAESAAQMMVVHLLRTYTTRAVSLKEPQRGLSPKQHRQITDYVQAHLSQPVSLEQLAQLIGFSPYHFARLFRQSTGESPHQFVLRQRIEYARHLLESSDLPLAQVAVETGFADQSHLTQTFRRYTGVTPKTFRRGR